MIRKFTREIASSQSQFKAQIERKYVTQQCSYNLPLELEECLNELGAIKKLNPNQPETSVKYILANNYCLKLGENVIAAVGENYKKVDNRIVFIHTEGANGSSKKLQLRKTDFQRFNDPKYKWFVDLYEKNIESTRLVVFVDDEKKCITIDLELTPYFFTGKSLADETNNCLEVQSQGINKIFYGIPGCGKSYHIEHNILGKNPKTKKYEGDYEEENIIRTTFYQDYSNTDFVGQILPKIVKGEDGEKDVVEYIFNPGPFTIALIQAIKNPTEKVALVVEEINRGNAPAIFGDIFQLLDRGDDGVSEYGIKNVSIIDYLNNYNFGDCEAPIHYTFENIKIPGNMDIFATMNTSDQNVYTLDTAFTRRWNKERIPNEFNGNEIADFLVPGMDKYTWKEFVDSINKQIQSKLDDLQVNEDKQVGAFFVKKSDLLPEDNTLTPDEKKEKAKSFAHKVLEYLWDDVSKLDHKVIFNPTYKTFEKVVDDYLKNGVAIFSSEIFKNKSIPETTVDTE